MTQFLQLPIECLVHPIEPRLPRAPGIGTRVVAALVAVPLASALLGSVVLLFGSAAA